MRIITMLLLLLFTASQAQPILDASDFPTEYSWTAYRTGTTGFTNGSSGANQIWDYSTMDIVETEYTITRIPIAEMPFYDQFPGANYCEKQNDNGFISYSAANLNSNTFESMGYVDGNNVVRYTDTNLVLQFPYTFNTVINDTYLSDIPDATLRSYRRTYDAYGTLITPFGTFTDVIRQKVENLTFGGIGYIWINSVNFQIILSGNFDDSIVYFFKDTTNLGVSQNHSQDFSIFPNPTQGDISIGNKQNFEGTATVYDMLGNVVNENKNVALSNLISLTNCSAGVYFVKITDQNNQVLQTKKIIKN